LLYTDQKQMKPSPMGIFAHKDLSIDSVPFKYVGTPDLELANEA